MSEVIVITSGKGGVGKTTTVANIGTGLAMMGKKTVVVDTDIGLRNLDVVLGLENRIVYNLVDVVEGNCRMKQALIRDKRYPNLSLLPSAQTRDKSAVNPEQMIKLIDDLRDDLHALLDLGGIFLIRISQRLKSSPFIHEIPRVDTHLLHVSGSLNRRLRIKMNIRRKRGRVTSPT